jgi:hypothetical protein
MEEAPKCIGCGNTNNVRFYGDPFRVSDGEYLCSNCACKSASLDTHVVQIRDFSHEPVRDTIIDLNASNPVEIIRQYGIWAQLRGSNNVTMTYYPKWQSTRDAMQVIFGHDSSLKRLEGLIDRLKSDSTH